MALSGAIDTLAIFAYQILAISLTFVLVLLVNRRLANAMELDIAARIQAEAEMRTAVSEAHRFRQALDRVPAYIYIKDRQHRCVYVNLPTLTLLGATEEAVLGTDGTQFFPADIASKLRVIDQQVIDEGEHSSEELDFVDPLGERRVFWEPNTPLYENGDSGEIWGLCGVATDVTARKLAEDQIRHLNASLEMRVEERTERLQQANERLSLMNRELMEANTLLEEATRAKNDFLAAMSHELRTPLNSIIGFSSIMLQGLTGDLSPEQDKQLCMINNSGRHLLGLINKVLDLAKVESGMSQPTFSMFDVCAGVCEMIDTVRPMAESKKLDLCASCSTHLRPVRTDGFFVNQIVLNLLGNAVKFTEDGYVNVVMAQAADGASISVEDSGCGISTEDLTHIFDDFFQVVPLHAAKSEGTGLGLSLSQRLAEQIGARITVSSEPGKGSTFTLHLPNTPV
jgi:PAS domain S-box-containing protein